MAIHFTKENFDKEVFHSDIPVLVDFWAAWCGPCRAVGPIIDELAVELAGKVKVGKVNVDEQPELGTKYNVMSIPTLMVVKNGKIEVQQAGGQDKAGILKMLGV